jgi:hypothetical protein
MLKMLMAGVLGGLAVAAMTGCPGIPAPVFDATGTYVGSWTGTAQDTEDPEAKQQTVDECPITLVLTQDFDAQWPANRTVQGSVTVDYSCVDLPERFPSIPPSTVDVSGILGENGDLTLLSGGCGTGFCVVLVMNGQGVDSDSDGFMDLYDGDWSYTILLAGVQPFGFTGTFETDIAVPEE